MMELGNYIQELANELGVTYEEKDAIKFITDKARKLKTAGSNCVAVSNETVKLWFKEFLTTPKEEKQEDSKQVKKETKEVKNDEYKQINLFEL